MYCSISWHLIIVSHWWGWIAVYQKVTADVVIEFAEPTNASQTLQAACVLSGYSSTGLQPSRWLCAWFIVCPATLSSSQEHAILAFLMHSCHSLPSKHLACAICKCLCATLCSVPMANSWITLLWPEQSDLEQKRELMWAILTCKVVHVKTLTCMRILNMHTIRLQDLLCDTYYWVLAYLPVIWSMETGWSSEAEQLCAWFSSRRRCSWSIKCQLRAMHPQASCYAA